MGSTFKHIGQFRCECGREFDNSQSFSGHKGHCSVHLKIKYGEDGELKKRDHDLKAGAAAGKTQRKNNELKKITNEKKWIDEGHYCERCGKRLTEKFGSGRFCSRACANSRKQTGEINSKRSETLKNKVSDVDRYLSYLNNPKLCKDCGKPIEFKRRRHNICKQCSLIRIHNRNVKAGKSSANSQREIRRSKNEIYFCELCENYFNTVKHNEQIFNGWDADVIIEDIKYAILWNGKWHYEQIMEGTSLKQIQNRDKIKVSEIKLAGYTPYIIKDLGKYNKKFVEEQFNLFLKHIAGGRSVSD